MGGNPLEYDYFLESLGIFEGLFCHLSSLILADCWKKLLNSQTLPWMTNICYIALDSIPTNRCSRTPSNSTGMLQRCCYNFSTICHRNNNTNNVNRRSPSLDRIRNGDRNPSFSQPVPWKYSLVGHVAVKFGTQAHTFQRNPLLPSSSSLSLNRAYPSVAVVATYQTTRRHASDNSNLLSLCCKDINPHTVPI